MSRFSWQVFIMESWMLMILVAMPGVWGGEWSVTVGDLCALKGTSVVMNCSYDYPFDHFVTGVGWFRSMYVSGKWKLVLLSRLPSPPDHFEYVGDYNSNCNMKINDVQLSDEGSYYFGFVTKLDKWTSQIPARLYVKELTAVVRPSTVAEGDDVSLTCVSGCPSIAVVWFRDGQRVLKTVIQARREDAGGYYCAVKGQETGRSATVVLNVQYAPKKATLSVSPPRGVVLNGSAVTFTCSGEANPPVTHRGYRLYKDGRFVSSGQNHTISRVGPGHSGLYLCQARSNVSRRRGVDPVNSTEIHLDVQYGPMTILVSLVPKQAVEGSGMNLTCSAVANPAADNYTWYKMTDPPGPSPSPGPGPGPGPGSGSMLQVGSGQVLTLPSVETSHTGLYLCKARNSLGEISSTELQLTVNRKERGSELHLIMAGVGTFLFVTLVIALLLYRKQRTRAEKKPSVFGSRLGGRGASPSAADVQLDAVYANVTDVASRPRRSGRRELATADQDEVTYSTVTVKPRNPSSPHHTNDSGAPQTSWSEGGEMDDSVIYATVTKSS